MDSRYCYYCKKDLPDRFFTASQKKFHAGKNVGRCSSCTSKRNKEYRSNNPDKLRVYEKSRRGCPKRKEHDRVRNYLRKYGITEKEYQEMRKQQEHRCVICNIHERDHKARGNGHLHVDHCHETNVVRGLLCKNCNTGLGCFKDNTGFLMAAKAYLENT